MVSNFQRLVTATTSPQCKKRMSLSRVLKARHPTHDNINDENCNGNSATHAAPVVRDAVVFKDNSENYDRVR